MVCEWPAVENVQYDGSFALFMKRLYTRYSASYYTAAQNILYYKASQARKRGFIMWATLKIHIGIESPKFAIYIYIHVCYKTFNSNFFHLNASILWVQLPKLLEFQWIHPKLPLPEFFSESGLINLNVKQQSLKSLYPEFTSINVEINHVISRTFAVRRRNGIGRDVTSG